MAEQKPATQPAHEMSREAANALERARDGGETISEADLREELGVGHDDLHTILNQLRELGMAEEVSPGEWSGPEAEPAAPVRVTVRPDEDGAGEEVGAAVSDEAEYVMAPAIRLTFAIVDALDEQSLGKLVKAGIAEAQEHKYPFVMEVL